MEQKNYWQHFSDCITKNYVNFDGRARRTEYWSFQLFSFLIRLALMLGALAIMGEGEMLSTIFGVAIILPSIAVGARRMHDVGKSGWYMLIPIYNIILFFTEGDKGPNEYGPDPKNPNLENEIDQIGTE